MATPSTDLEYNDSSREIQMRYDIYFDSLSPLVVTRENYLISSTGLEEVQSESKDILGSVSSNEITLELFNEDRIFTPTNPDSPYYGKIKRNVRIAAYGRAMTEDDDTEWDALGVFYVKDWNTSTSGLIASVVANDILYDIFDAPMPVYYVQKNVAIKDLLDQFFDLFDITATIDESIDFMLTYAFVNSENKDFLTSVINGALALCYGNRTGGVTVLSRLSEIPLRATFTDDDQLVDITTQQSIEAGYTGVSVPLYTTQESADVELVTLTEQTVPNGSSTITSSFYKTPVMRVSYGEVISDTPGSVRIESFYATPNDIYITVNNESSERDVQTSIVGTYIESIESANVDGGNSLLTLKSKYIQEKDHCDTAMAFLNRAVDSNMPFLSLKIRGNFKLGLGDKIRVNSQRLKVDYTGILIRHEYTYDGGLSASVTLMDASLFGEVT